MWNFQRIDRNKQLNSDFATLYQESVSAPHGRTSFMRIYRTLSEKYGISEMQVRRIVRGYTKRKTFC
jgi:hypothetical protein